MKRLREWYRRFMSDHGDGTDHVWTSDGWSATCLRCGVSEWLSPDRID